MLSLEQDMSKATAPTPLNDLDHQILDPDALEKAPVAHEPFTYLVAHNVISKAFLPLFADDFPKMDKPGFLPIDCVKRQGVFDQLVREIEGPRIATILSDKLGLDLVDKPRIITVRKWSAAQDGRIHVDGQSKLVTSLIYLNASWPEDEDGGRFRVLRSNKSFDDCAAEILPVFGTFVAFVRTDQSWHGHKPFVGERRVLQTAWLRSHADLERKERQGRFTLRLKNLLMPRAQN